MRRAAFALALLAALPALAQPAAAQPRFQPSPQAIASLLPGLAMVRIPAGVLPGLPCGQDCPAGQRTVQVPVAAFEISRDEITLGQFQAFMRDSGQREADTWLFRFSNHREKPLDAPVTEVSWHDAQAFVDWLNQTHGSPHGGRWRLPTLHEWEYACRAGQAGVCGMQPLAAGANAWGVRHMGQRVQEWVQDCRYGLLNLCHGSASRLLRSNQNQVFRVTDTHGALTYQPPPPATAADPKPDPLPLGFRVVRDALSSAPP